MQMRIAAALAITFALACDPPEMRANTINCVNEPAAQPGAFCFQQGDVCPLQPAPGTVCAEGGPIAVSATCTCADAGKWSCEEDAAILCDQPACSFGAPCTPGETCDSPSRGTLLSCDPTGHLAQCNPGQTKQMGCDSCVCQMGEWACSTEGCGDAAPE
jgi:hypothetical protein